jgi:hypothetical protein
VEYAIFWVLEMMLDRLQLHSALFTGLFPFSFPVCCPAQGMREIQAGWDWKGGFP